MLQLSSRRRARGRTELGPPQRRHWQSQEHQEPAAGTSNPARHVAGGAGNGENSGPRRHQAHPLHRATRGSCLCHRRYLKSLKPVPSPTWCTASFPRQQSAAKSVFPRRLCRMPSPAALHAISTSTDVGTRRPFDKPGDRFDTPSLIEVWRTAPYLHDGSAVTVREVLTTRNRHDRHGRTAALTAQELDDLCAYVLSL